MKKKLFKSLNTIDRIKNTENEAEIIYRIAKNQGKRWPEAEPIILKDPFTAYMYALNVIKDRWPEAEPLFLQHLDVGLMYAYNVLRDRWPELEKKLSNEDKVTYLLIIRRIKNRLKGKK